MKDKFKAVWLSHSSISDYLKCPRLYFLRNVYKDPRTGHKITIGSPALTLGMIVHEVIESMSTLAVEDRFTIKPTQKFDVAWQKVSGKQGGFVSLEEESEYRSRGFSMIRKLEENPGPLLKKTIKIRADGGLPYYWLSEPDNIILCGKIDWLIYDETNDSVHILDFKTGKNEESEESLQLPIYYLLSKNLQNRQINGASYWYLDKDEGPREVNLPDEKKSEEYIFEVGKKIKLARQLEVFKCPYGGCRNCMGLERILKGEGEKVGVSEYNQDIYFLRK
ncbi:MAG: PD-(D/E)XK nuclease family protein [Candidatus Woesebacteria bacterium]|nr:MAG: PD-(D/E)XK nuclease family protein [Candidatus Woesebacteria bacterium]